MKLIFSFPQQIFLTACGGRNIFENWTNFSQTMNGEEIVMF